MVQPCISKNLEIKAFVLKILVIYILFKLLLFFCLVIVKSRWLSRFIFTLCHRLMELFKQFCRVWCIYWPNIPPFLCFFFIQSNTTVFCMCSPYQPTWNPDIKFICISCNIYVLCSLSLSLPLSLSFSPLLLELQYICYWLHSFVLVRQSQELLWIIVRHSSLF